MTRPCSTQRRLLILLLRQNPLRALLTALDANTNTTILYDGPLEPVHPLVQLLAELNEDLLVCKGPEPVRQHVVPLAIREQLEIPSCLLRYIDVGMLRVVEEQPGGEEDKEMDVETQTIIQSVSDFSTEDLEKAIQTVNLGVELAVCDRETKIEGEVVVRARGLPWQASDSHVAQFFAGLEIAPGGIALCLSAEGRRNGEALVRFRSEQMRDLALKRHRHFLLARYIEVYKATAEEFLHVAAGSSSEAVNFVSTGAAMIVRMRGLPYDCTEQQIRDFFNREPNACEIMDQVLFVTRSDGRPTGDAFVQFVDEENGVKALAKHRQTIGNRYIELFRSTSAEVQQVVKRSSEPTTPTSARRDCVRLRGLPYEARVAQVVEFLGEHANNIVYHGVHMVFNSQGHPSGECFIQMHNEQAAAAAAVSAHNKFMVIGKKQRYIEVFQCSQEDMNLVTCTPMTSPNMAPPPLILPQRQTSFVPGIAPMVPMTAPVFWPYPSPPVSPNMMMPGQVQHILVRCLPPTTGVAELIAQFQNECVVVENVVFTQMAQANMPGEALVTIRIRSPSDPPVVPIDPQFLNKVPMESQFIPLSMPQAMPQQQLYTVIQS